MIDNEKTENMKSSEAIENEENDTTEDKFSTEDSEENLNESEPTKKEKKAEDSKYKKENVILKDANTKLEKQINELNDKYLRLVAEYDNFRKRSQKEKDGVYADAYSDCTKQLLPTIDNLERAVLFSDSEKVVDGVKMTLSALTETFGKLGIEEIETKTFDPNYHNAVMHIEDENYGEGEIVEVFQKGYKKGDKVIRYAMVKVAN